MKPQWQKIFELLSAARSVILLPGAYPLTEEIAALAMLGLLLEHNRKDVTFLLPAQLVKEYASELPWPKGLTPALPSAREFVISIDTAARPVTSLRYEKEGPSLRIYLQSQDQPLQPEHVTFAEQSESRFDCALVLGARRIDLIAENEHVSRLLTETPLVNIDDDPANEAFGDYNLALPRGQILPAFAELFSLFPSGEHVLSAWQSQRRPALGPSTLRLLGRALARLGQDTTLWSMIVAPDDFGRAGANVEEFVRALPSLAALAEMTLRPFALFWKQNSQNHALVVSRDEGFTHRVKQACAGWYSLAGWRLALKEGDIADEERRVRAALAAIPEAREL